MQNFGNFLCYTKCTKRSMAHINHALNSSCRSLVALLPLYVSIGTRASPSDAYNVRCQVSVTVCGECVGPFPGRFVIDWVRTSPSCVSRQIKRANTWRPLKTSDSGLCLYLTSVKNRPCPSFSLPILSWIFISSFSNSIFVRNRRRKGPSPPPKQMPCILRPAALKGLRI